MNVRHRFLVLAAFLMGFCMPLHCQQAPADPLHPSTLLTERRLRREAFRQAPTVAAVKAGLGWLLAHQDEDGGWDCDGFMKHDPAPVAGDGAGNATLDLGVTGLALLALLAQGDDATKAAMRKAADYILATQISKPGYFACDSQDYIYVHAIATIAMVEAAAVLGDPRYRDAIEPAFRALEVHRNPGAAWRYKQHGGDNDSSITGWCVAAYTMASQAGFAVRAESVGEALAWLDSITDPKTGHCGYMVRGEPSARTPETVKTFPIDRTETLTAVAMNARSNAGFSMTSGADRAATELVLSKPPQWSSETIDYYYWYHGSEVMAALPDRAAGQKWLAAVQKALVPAQRKDGASRGSWDPKDPWGAVGGRIAATALAVLALSSPYRVGPSPAAAVVPSSATFSRVQTAWRQGRPGAVREALAGVLASGVAVDPAEVRRIEWFLQVQSSFCERLVARSAELHPDLAERHAHLQELAVTHAGTPGGKAAAAAAETMMSTPAVREEVEAANLLRSIFATFNERKPPTETSKRRVLREQFAALVAKYPTAPAAARAREWIGFLQ